MSIFVPHNHCFEVVMQATMRKTYIISIYLSK